MTLQDLIREIVGQLETAGIPYMVTGSVASSYHGEPRATRDLDVVIEPDSRSLVALVQRMAAGGKYVDLDAAMEALRTRTQFNAIDPATGWKVDFVIRKDRPFSREEFARRMRVDLLGSQAWLARPEDLIIAKLEWGVAAASDRQLEDVVALLRVGRGSLDLDYVARWVGALDLGAAWGRLSDQA